MFAEHSCLSDGLSSSALIQIRVEDKNDNPPRFYPTVYNVSLRQDVTPGLPLLVVSATDADDGIFGEVNYRISSGDQGGLFRIDSKRGDRLQYIRCYLDKAVASIILLVQRALKGV